MKQTKSKTKKNKKTNKQTITSHFLIIFRVKTFRVLSYIDNIFLDNNNNIYKKNKTNTKSQHKFMIEVISSTTTKQKNSKKLKYKC